MVRFANERHNIIGNATARLWVFKNIVSKEGQPFRRFYELPLTRNESPALALSWTLFHVIDETSPLYGLDADGLEAANVSLVVVVSGYDVVAAQTVHARKSYDHPDIRFGHRYAEILEHHRRRPAQDRLRPVPRHHFGLKSVLPARQHFLGTATRAC